MRKISILVVLFACQLIRAEEIRQIGAPQSDRPLIQMAILLDTSGSMNGLINQARAHLWRVVNEFISAKRAGQSPVVQVALYQYGSGPLGAQTGYMRQVVPLTTDLDKVSQELFALKIGGSLEYCGQAIKMAVEGLEWSKNNKDLKTIFICGNEPFTQGKVDYKVACKLAIDNGIVVNTIHCGPESEGISGMWKDGAVLADGQFICINQNKAVVNIEAPQDKEIAKLNGDLNGTYVAYGAHGKAAAANQAAQDGNALRLGNESFGQRANTKASSNYRNDSWDLVDALKDDSKKLEALKKEDLPEAMQNLSLDEQKAYVEKKGKERADIKDKLVKLNAERGQYVADEMKKRATESKGDSLDEAMVKAIHEQAKKKDFAF